MFCKTIWFTKTIWYILSRHLQILCANLQVFVLGLFSPASRDVFPILSWILFWNHLLHFIASLAISDPSMAVIHSLLADFCLCPWPHKYLGLKDDSRASEFCQSPGQAVDLKNSWFWRKML